jgi:transcriptional regulator with XRE-family HTH domain
MFTRKFLRSLGGRLAEQRVAAGLSFLGAALRLGISENKLAQIEKGKHAITGDDLPRFCRAYRLDPYRILFGKPFPKGFFQEPRAFEDREVSPPQKAPGQGKCSRHAERVDYTCRAAS